MDTTTTDTVLYIHCPSCGTTNRVPKARIDAGERPVCGKCKAPLPIEAAQPSPTDGTPLTVTDASFAADVEQSPIPVLVDLWAPWCAPCRMIAPTIDQLAAEMAGKVRFAKLNIDENPATARRFNVASIPTLLILKSGREVDRIVGVQSKASIAERLQKLAGA